MIHKEGLWWKRLVILSKLLKSVKIFLLSFEKEKKSVKLEEEKIEEEDGVGVKRKFNLKRKN